MRRSTVLSALFAIVLLPACAYFEPTGRHAKLYAGSSISLAGKAGEIDRSEGAHNPVITAFVAPPVPPAPRPVQTVANLPPEGMAAAIEALTAGGTAASREQILQLLNSRIGPDPGPGTTDYTRIDGRLVVTVDSLPVTQNGQAPANRIDALQVTFKLNPPDACKAIFSDWQQLSNQRRTVNISQIESETGAKAGVTAGFTTLSPDLSTLGPSAEVTRRLKETIAVRQDQLSLYGGLSANELFYVERGAPLTDLGGTTSFDFGMRLPAAETRFAVDELRVTNGNLELSGRGVSLPDRESCMSLELNWNWSALVRKVKKGHNTFIEADDEVEIVPVSPIQDGTLSLKALIRGSGPRFWILTSVEQEPCFLTVRTRNFEDATRALLFRRLEHANALLDWVRAQPDGQFWTFGGSNETIFLECPDGPRNVSQTHLQLAVYE